MEYFPAPLEKLVEQFARLPGIGGKSAQRLAFHVLNLPMEEAEAFAHAIVDANTCHQCIHAGANVLVAGSAVYKAEDIPQRIKELRG